MNATELGNDEREMLSPHKSHVRDIRGEALLFLTESIDPTSRLRLLERIIQRCDDLRGWQLRPDQRGWVVAQLTRFMNQTAYRDAPDELRSVVATAIDCMTGLILAEATSGGRGSIDAAHVYSSLERGRLGDFGPEL